MNYILLEQEEDLTSESDLGEMICIEPELGYMKPESDNDDSKVRVSLFGDITIFAFFKSNFFISSELHGFIYKLNSVDTFSISHRYKTLIDV